MLITVFATLSASAPAPGTPAAAPVAPPTAAAPAIAASALPENYPWVRLAETARPAVDLLGLDVGPLEIADLVPRTQGWAAGLRLAAMGAAAAPDPEGFVASISGRSDYIADYLMREVYEGLDREWRDFLARVGVVDEISAGLAEALGAGPDSEARLDELVRQTLSSTSSAIVWLVPVASAAA